MLESKKIIKVISCIIVFSFMGYLLIYSNEVNAVFRKGIQQWYTGILPILFPFMVFSQILLSYDMFSVFHPFLSLIEKAFDISFYAAIVIMAGFLFGFPMGSRLTSTFSKNNLLTEREACFLPGFTNNLSPAFLMSYAAVAKLRIPQNRYFILLTIWLASFMWGLFLFRVKYKNKDQRTRDNLPNGSASPFGEILNRSISESVNSILIIGGYISLFYIISHFLFSHFPFTNPFTLFLFSCIEPVNGVAYIASSDYTIALRFLLSCCCCAFGGISGIMQTISIGNLNAYQTKTYIKSRVMITLLSFIICSIEILLIF